MEHPGASWNILELPGASFSLLPAFLVYLLQPQGVVLHDALQLLDLQAGLGRRRVSLDGVGVVLTGPAAAASGLSAAGLSLLRQDECVGALPMLDLMKPLLIAFTTAHSHQEEGEQKQRAASNMEANHHVRISR